MVVGRFDSRLLSAGGAIRLSPPKAVPFPSASSTPTSCEALAKQDRLFASSTPRLPGVMIMHGPILIVSDDAELRASLSRLLREGGCADGLAACVPAALESH